jgi:LDH2 family malate/lactate/ureidoglycolate dehydrogenase
MKASLVELRTLVQSVLQAAGANEAMAASTARAPNRRASARTDCRGWRSTRRI